MLEWWFKILLVTQNFVNFSAPCTDTPQWKCLQYCAFLRFEYSKKIPSFKTGILPDYSKWFKQEFLCKFLSRFFRVKYIPVHVFLLLKFPHWIHQRFFEEIQPEFFVCLFLQFFKKRSNDLSCNLQTNFFNNYFRYSSVICSEIL